MDDVDDMDDVDGNETEEDGRFRDDRWAGTAKRGVFDLRNKAGIIFLVLLVARV